MASFFARMLPGMQARLKLLYDAGVPLALGTDRSFGPTVHEELRLIVDSGVPPLAALKMATGNAALYLGLEDELGTLAPGKRADLILLGANPLLDIANSTSVDWVMLNGRPIDRFALNLPVNGWDADDLIP
jgi:imidazolonepropionase-like amidohydrolase